MGWNCSHFFCRFRTSGKQSSPFNVTHRGFSSRDASTPPVSHRRSYSLRLLKLHSPSMVFLVPVEVPQCSDQWSSLPRRLHPIECAFLVSTNHQKDLVVVVNHRPPPHYLPPSCHFFPLTEDSPHRLVL